MEIIRVFFQVHMGRSFDGLLTIAKSNKTKITPSSMVLFINSKKNKFKVLIGDNNLIYHRTKDDRVFPLEAVKHFPLFFDGKEIDYNAAVAKSIKDKFGEP